MLFASEDPLNFILACVWSLMLLGSLSLTWYAYILWKKYPDDSISHNIAVYVRQYQQRFIIGFIVGTTIGVMTGVILGMFAGHWFWPVELVR